MGTVMSDPGGSDEKKPWMSGGTGGGGDWLFELWWNWFLSNPIEVVTVKIG